MPFLKSTANYSTLYMVRISNWLKAIRNWNSFPHQFVNLVYISE